LSQARGRYLSICHVIGVAGAGLVLVAFVPRFGIMAAVAAIYFEFALFRIAIEFEDWRAGEHLPFQDLPVLMGVLMIGSAVAIVDFWDLALWPRVVLLIVGLVLTVTVHHRAMRDMLSHGGEIAASLIGRRVPSTRT
jgi:hypothetical protein